MSAVDLLQHRRFGIRRLASRPAVAVASATLAVLVLVVVSAPLIAPHDPVASDLTKVNLGPSATFPLGTDSNGRDLLSRLVYGGRTALLGPLVVGAFSTLLGTSLALVAAWRGGRIDAFISSGFNLLFAFPGLLLAILAAATFGKGLLAATVALAISYTPYVGRVVRGAALGHLRYPYLAGLRAAGFGGWHIAVKHVVPNLRSLILSQAAVMFGYSMMDLAAISFLGLGVQQPTPDWGSMVAEGLPSILSGFPQEALLASALIVLTVVAVNLLGERLGDDEGVRP